MKVAEEVGHGHAGRELAGPSGVAPSFQWLGRRHQAAEPDDQRTHVFVPPVTNEERLPFLVEATIQRAVLRFQLEVEDEVGLRVPAPGDPDPRPIPLKGGHNVARFEPPIRIARWAHDGGFAHDPLYGLTTTRPGTPASWSIPSKYFTAFGSLVMISTAVAGVLGSRTTSA